MSAFALPKPPGRLTALPSSANGTLRYHPEIGCRQSVIGTMLNARAELHQLTQDLAVLIALPDWRDEPEATARRLAGRHPGLPRPTLACHPPSDHWSLITDLRIQSFGSRLEPRYIFGAETLD